MSAPARGRAPAFSRWWARCYTRGLPVDARDARRAEIDSDVFEHVNDATARGAGRGVDAAVVGRTLRGMGDDLLWRLREGRAMRQGQGVEGLPPKGLRAVWATATQAWFTPVAVLIGLFDGLMAVVVLADPNGKMPRQVIGPVIIAAMATALFAGLRLRWRSGLGAPELANAAAEPRVAPRSTLGLRIALGGIALLAAAAVVFGVIGSLVLLVAGVLTLGAVAAIAARRRNQPVRAEAVAGGAATGAQGVMLADVLIVIGVLPALGLFWQVVPPILALVVIAGVIGTGPGTRRRAAS